MFLEVVAHFGDVPVVVDRLLLGFEELEFDVFEHGLVQVDD